MEQLKQKQRMALLFFILFIAVMIIAVVVFFVGTLNNAKLAIAIILAIIGAICFIIGLRNANQVKRIFKNEVLAEVFRRELPDSTYEPSRGLSEDYIRQARITPWDYDRFHSEDLVYGSYQDVPFHTCDVLYQEERRDREGNVRYVTIFQGRYFDFEFPKAFKSNVIVTENKHYRYPDLERVEMESDVFNQKFRTHSTQALDAFYVLTPHLMEAILEIEARYRGVVSLSFNENVLSISINNMRDTFHFSLFSNIENTVNYVIEHEIQVIKDIVEVLKLERKIFK